MPIIKVAKRGGDEKTVTVTVESVEVTDSWESVFLPRLAMAVGLGGPGDIAYLFLRDATGCEEVLYTTLETTR